MRSHLGKSWDWQKWPTFGRGNRQRAMGNSWVGWLGTKVVALEFPRPTSGSGAPSWVGRLRWTGFKSSSNAFTVACSLFPIAFNTPFHPIVSKTSNIIFTKSRRYLGLNQYHICPWDFGSHGANHSGFIFSASCDRSCSKLEQMCRASYDCTRSVNR